MTPREQAAVAAEIVATIQRNLQSKRWLYWPPGPMVGQVFDRDRCYEDIRYALTKFPDDRPSPVAGKQGGEA